MLHVSGVYAVSPHPFTRPKYFVMVFEGLCALEGSCIMHAASVAQQVVNNLKMLRHTDDLKSE